MQMLTKFESRSSRTKAVAFHPTRPWVIVGLYSSTIQLWDYRMGALLDRFEGHQGPVRGVDVHPTQQIFVSCGDDQLIRVWSLSERRLLFALEGHQDYVRTAFFHRELPWIVSASDDQTVRIWDWQARREIALLTGHNHWVSCAVFHPTEDLIVSSSLDTTVRAWDISGLRRRHSAAGVIPVPGVPGGVPVPGGFNPGFPGGIPGGLPGGRGPVGGGPAIAEDDIFGNEVVTKFILQGHDRGVTWVACHPTQPLIVSASDDRTLKVWRTSESRAWEIDTCRGHRDEVTGCAFHPFADVIISCSTDETIRTWDLNKRTQIKSFAKAHNSGKADAANRYWGLRFHPTENLIGAALDGGVQIFKLERERPAFVLTPKLLYVSQDKQLRDSNGKPLLSFSKFLSNQHTPVTELSYNPAENAVVATFGSQAAGFRYVLCRLGLNKGVEGDGLQALFVTRNRFCVLVSPEQLELRDMDNSRTKQITLPIETKRIAPAMQGHVLLLGAKSVVLFDIQQRQVVAKLAAKSVKYAAWSPDMSHVAFVHKHDIVIATRELKHVSTLYETMRVKSIAWDKDLPMLVYTTFSHLKYALPNDESGILCTLDETLYATQVSGSKVTALTRRGTIKTLEIDPTEYRFKLALINNNFAEVARLIQTSSLVGQSIIAYLQKRGHPEIALEFVQDPQTRLDLAVESGNLDVAAQAAASLQGATFDEVLANAALEQGNHDLLEDVYQRQRDFDKLAFIYHVTGNRSRMQRLEQLAMQRGDASARFQTSLFLNSVENRVSLLQEAGLAPLAYALAKSQGLTDEADEIREDAGIDESKIKISLTSGRSSGLSVVNETWKENWPVNKKTSTSILDLAKLSLNDSSKSTKSKEGDSAATSLGPAGADVSEDPVDLGDEWDLDDELDEEAVNDVEAPTGATPEVSATDEWVRKSTVPSDHIAAGSFETAAQLLNRQVGVVRFETLKQRFLDVYSASKLALPGHQGLPPLPYYILRGPDNDLPYIPGYDYLQSRLSEAFAQVKANQLELALESFRSVLHIIVTLAVSTEQEEAEVKKIIETCRNYILAFSIELHRRALPKDEVKRSLELAAYFTTPKLLNAHAVLPLRTAVVQASNAKNFSLASHFAEKYLQIDSSSPNSEKMRRNKARWDMSRTLDEVDIEFDAFAEFDIDPISLTPIYEGQPVVYDPLTKAKYHAENKGKLCAITEITEVGAAASGLRLRA